MSRIDDDIVAKAAFYAGLSQTLAPEELADDIRSNGNSLLKDAVDSISADKLVDRGLIKKVVQLEDGKATFNSRSRCVPFNVIHNGKLLTLVGVEDFLTTYANNRNVACIYHSVEDVEETLEIGSVISDDEENVLQDDEGNLISESGKYIRDTEDDIIVVETHLGSEEVTILCNRSLSLDASLGYLRVDCRKEVKAYVVDYTAYLLASLYQMATKDDCASRMELSLQHCKKVEVPHIMVNDVVTAMGNMYGQSPQRPNPMRGY